MKEEKNLNFHEYKLFWSDLGLETLQWPDETSIQNGATPQSELPLPGTPQATQEKNYSSLPAIQTEIGDCHRCGLWQKRKTIVFGSGDPKARLMFVGEGPGADEDTQGQPFVGRAGQLLTKIIEAIGYERSSVYIANVVKCRPPDNRVPFPEEVQQCLPFLKAQIEVIGPLLIVALGATAASHLISHKGTMTSLRGKFKPLSWNPQILVLPTYHPAYLLRNPSAKKVVWEDMKQVKACLGQIQ